MIPENSIVYLETSALNYFTDFQTAGDALATRVFHQLKGTKFVVSSVGIMEILLTSSSDRREELIYHLQHLANRILVVSPAEIAINYIKAGCPYAETKYNLASALPLSPVFTDVIDHSNRTFIFDKDDIRNIAKGVFEAFKYIRSIIEYPGMTAVELTELQRLQLMMDETLQQMKTIRYANMSETNKKQYKLNMMLITAVLCRGIGFDREFVDAFWKQVGINNPAERFTYIFNNFEALIYRGPFTVMSDTILAQLKHGRKPTRGIFWDALHSVYLIYTDIFLSADSHFKQLRNDHEHFQYKRIVYLPEANIFTAKEIRIVDPDTHL